METDCISHKATGYFSPLIIDYLEQQASLAPFYQYTPTDEGMDRAIADRKKFPVDRALLVNTLKAQYAGIDISDSVRDNIAALTEEQTFTVCTAHQPNLLTGYLYFIYKIIHTARLARHLQTRHPEARFVPVYYIGSEDNDLDELGVFRYEQRKFRWETDQTGAVGRMHTRDLKPLLEELYRIIGPPGEQADRLQDIIRAAYEGQATIAAATRYIVNAFLGSFGVVVIDADDVALKQAFVPVIKDELLEGRSFKLVKEPSEALSRLYKAQAFARPINLFYLKDDLRERIEATDTGYKVVHSTISWTTEELMEEVTNHPERFSPNVILRGLYQETILPNVAFIGGGSEVAYWMQLKPIFNHYDVFFPPLILRQSFLWIAEEQRVLQEKTGCSDTELFEPTEQLARAFVRKHTHKDMELEDIRQQLQHTLLQLKTKATAIDTTLNASVEAALTKMRHQVDVVEKKMMRAEKQHMGVRLAQVYRLKQQLFPNGTLQERQENFMPYYLRYGEAYFEALYAATLPYGDGFVLIKA